MDAFLEVQDFIVREPALVLVRASQDVLYTYSAAIEGAVVYLQEPGSHVGKHGIERGYSGNKSVQVLLTSYRVRKLLRETERRRIISDAFSSHVFAEEIVL